MESSIQFISISPNDFKKELIKDIKDELLQDLEKKFNQKEQNKYLSTKQVCSMFSISKPTLHEWRSRGIINTHRLGGRVYFRLDEIEVAMTSRNEI